jgi:hypothetical protein
LRVLGVDATSCTAGEVWRHLRASLDATLDLAGESRQALDVILEHGPLARRILRALGADTGLPAPVEARLDHASLRTVYARLSDCLASGAIFVPASSP